jgi:WD40 repeat protein/DNA-binding CsgD family transcriptional regulator/GTPase SAR1 family protein
MIEVSEDVLRAVALEHGVSKLELDALNGALVGQTAEAIAATLGISAPAVRKRLRSVYQKFGISGTTPGKVEAVKRILMQSPHTAKSSSTPPPSEAPEVATFFGRSTELATLQNWIVKITSGNHCQLVAVWGMGGIGKTTLAAKLVQQLEHQFERVIWRSLLNAPLLNDVLSELLQSFDQQETELPGTVDERLSQLINCLQKHRYLIVLDNVEAILQHGKLAGIYKEDYENYGELFTKVGASVHQSCLVMTSREKPKEVALLEVATSAVQSLRLEGLQTQEAQEILKGKGLVVSEEEFDLYRQLIYRYRGNPLALKIIATTIQDIFGGQVADFLGEDEGLVFLGDLRSLLDQQFNRLSSLEKDIMDWLVINREPVSITQLREDFVLPVPLNQISEAIESLRRRSLIEIERGGCFTLQPVVMDYITENLTEQICEEVKTEHIDLLNRYALIKADAKDYIKEIQTRLILQPLLDRLRAVFGGETRTVDQLGRLLAALPKHQPPKPSYAGGNLANLLCQLKDTIDETYDFSNLAVWQADLRYVNLYGVNFTNSNLEKSVFAETLSSILSVAFSSDGKWFATGDVDGSVRLWHVADGKFYLMWQGKHTSWVRSVVFNPEGTILASGGGDQAITLWDVKTGQCLKTLMDSAPVRTVAFNNTGSLLASGSDDHAVRLWDTQTGDCLNTLDGHTNWVWSVAFSSDGVILASAGEDQSIRVWDVRTGQCLRRLPGHTNWVSSLAFAPDGVTLVSGSGDCTVRTWDIRTGECLRIFGQNQLEAHTNWVWSVAFGFAGQTVISSSDDHTIKVWETRTGRCVSTLRGHKNRVGAVAIAPNGELLASGSEDQTVRFWDVSTQQCLKILQGYTNRISAVAFSPHGWFLVSSSDDGTIGVWDVRSWQCFTTLRGHHNRVGAIAFSCDGTLLASGSDDGTIRVWDVRSWNCIKVLKDHTNWVSAVTFSSDGMLLASGSDDGTIRVWDVLTWTCIKVLKDHTSRLRTIAFSPDGTLFASGNDDKTIKLWDVRTWESLQSLTDDNWVWSIAFSPDSTKLASGNDDCTVKIWQIGSSDCSTLSGHTAPLRAVAFSPDGTTLASGAGDKTVRLWDVQTNQCLTILENHTNWVKSVAFSPDGTMLVSGSDDETIKVWDVQKHELLETLRSEKPYQNMNITGITGLTAPQQASLKALGAIER